MLKKRGKVDNSIDKKIIEYHNLFQRIKRESSKIIVGQDEVIDGIINAMICNGHVLVEGIPGIAKTLIIRTLGKICGCKYSRIQFTADLLPTDITGLTSYDQKKKEFTVIKGPIFANFIIADEVNRSPPKCVLGDTPVITSEGDISNINSIIKNYNGKKVYKKNNEYWIIPKKKLKLLAFDISDFKIKPEEVKYLYKQKTSEPYYKVKLKSGRNIKTSKIHPFFTLVKGEIKTIQANELKKGDCVLIPKKLPISGDNKLIYDKEFLKKSEEINNKIIKRKKLYAKVQYYKKQNIKYKNLKEKLKIDNKQDENLIKTFLKIKPNYLNYPKKGYLFPKSKQFGQIHGIKKPNYVNKDFARFIAILISEGSVNKNYFYLSMKDKKIVELFIKCIKNVFDLNVNLLYNKKRNMHRVAFRSDALIELLKGIGYDPNLKSNNKYVPKFILTSTDDVAKEFLKLYYECDGCVSRDCLKVTTKSKKIANALSYLLLRSGFVAKINKDISKTNIGNYSYKRSFYNLRLYGGELYDFYKKINFFTEKNSKKLKDLIKNVKREKVDLLSGLHETIRNIRKKKGITHKQFYNLTGMHAHNLENINNSLTHSRYRLKKLMNIFNKNDVDSVYISKLIDGDFYCDFVKGNELIKPKKDYWLYDFSMKNKHSFVAGFGGIISHNTQSAMLEAMQEKQVSIGRTTYSLPLPFFVMATQNPIESSGVYKLPEAQIDRFLFKLNIVYPKLEEEHEILVKNITTEKFENYKLNQVLNPEKILEMQEFVKKIHLNDDVKNYIINLVDATRNPNKYGIKTGRFIEWGGSPRASIGLYIAAKAEALLNGKSFVTPHHVKAVAHNVLRHRLLLNYEGQAENINRDDIITEILNKVPAP